MYISYPRPCYVGDLAGKGGVIAESKRRVYVEALGEEESAEVLSPDHMGEIANGRLVKSLPRSAVVFDQHTAGWFRL